MNILIDFTQIPLDRTGAGVYAQKLLRELPAFLQASDTLYVLTQDDDAGVARMLEQIPNAVAVGVPARLFRNRVLLLLYEQLLLPLVLLRHRIDVAHSLHYTHPLWTPSALVVTVHDMTHTLFPELHTRGRRWLNPLFVRHAMREADCTIFVSASTKRDAERVFGGCSRAGVAVPLAVDAGSASVGTAEREAELLAMEVSPPFLLFIGTFEPRKNIERLIAAFERIAATAPVHLVLAGKLGWNYEPILQAIKSSPFRHRIRRLGFITEIQKRVLLQSCRALVYPSLYEGFGLPVLEAMAAGAPVITSNLSSLPEVAGDAALLIDPASVDALVEAIRRVLDEPELAEEMRRKGLVQARQFSWRRTAELTYRVYQQVFRSRHRSEMLKGHPDAAAGVSSAD